jgi:hypothetical protein
MNMWQMCGVDLPKPAPTSASAFAARAYSHNISTSDNQGTPEENLISVSESLAKTWKNRHFDLVSDF